MTPNILFIHSVCPGQFSDLCEHLNNSGLANAWYLTTPGNRERNRQRYRNLLAFEPDGNIIGANKYYYSGKVERSARIGVGLYRCLAEIIANYKIDLIVAHGSWGSPHLLFGEFDVPIITYIEFPSYADHGWDPSYPPTQAQRLADKNMQMLSYYQAARSDLTLVPTEYARRLFPHYLRDRIVARFEGFDPEAVAARERSSVALPDGVTTIGFAARDLSSAKGLDTFLATAAHLLAEQRDYHFVVIGDENATSYSFETVFLDRTYGKERTTSFLGHLFNTLGLDRERFTITGKLPYAEFSDLIQRIDLFLYPVRFGSGNWGLAELLLRGAAVVAADRCYVPELIADGDNGLLVQGDDPADWAAAAVRLAQDNTLRETLGARARATASAYHLPTVAPGYLALFERVIAARKDAGAAR